MSGVLEAAASCEPLTVAHGVAIDIDERSAGIVLGQSQRLVQVFVNLIENAVQHSPRGSTVKVGVHRAGGRLSCAVVDRGPGFASEDLARVFEPFFSRRRGGTGLGLPIVRRIVREHRGEVEVSVAPGGGACVTVALPDAGDGAEPAA